ncbi:AzlC family ABC transporter permease [Alkalilacustris brevis]|uniref:AzlC family ABC transporter permease n=1 Tax=Alkalilacustris brevis TaxID=2026338 RepID=UPI000E0D72F0|nr:AzlC family ABC transporter permease [Alkalilacustris brevis]
MDQISTRAAYWNGFRAGAPFLLVIVPFGMVFGVIATEAGFNIAEVMGFSVLVIAGAAQLAAVQLMTENAPTLVILATALAVNLRMAMYSAAMAPHLGSAPFWTRGFMAYFLVDQSYGVSAIEFENRPDMSIAAKTAFFFGSITPVCFPWYLATWAGAVLGASFPSGLGLDFAVPITFLAIIAPMLRTAAHVAAAITSVVLALGLAFLPYNLGLLLAAGCAMAVGAWVEHLMARRRAA